MFVMFQTAELYSISPWALAVKRVPALILTMALELVGGVVIDQLHRVERVEDDIANNRNTELR